MDKILLIQTASIGDVILATPLLEKLHRYHPKAHLDILVKKGNESLFTGHPFLNNILIWEKNHHKYRNLFKLLWKLRRERYDLVINLQRFFSTGLLTAASGARQKVGFTKNPLSFFYTFRYSHSIGETANWHETDRNLELIKEFTGPGEAPVRLYPSVADVQYVEKYKKAKFICLAPASLWYTKQFPKEKWIAFLDRIPEELVVWLLGSKQDEDLCSDIVRHTRHQQTKSLAGRLSLLQSAALMKNAQMNYMNDSAPMHLASAVDAPVTVIFCSTIPEFGFGPLSTNAAIVQTEKELTCKPCGLHGFNACPEKHFDCAKTILIDRLLDRL